MNVLIENLYEVKSFENNNGAVIATVTLNKDHEIFNGHFPDNPVMPGVCMIQMIKELTERATAKKLFLSSCSNIKFMAIIDPEENKLLNLTINYSEDDGIIKIKNTATYEDTLALKLNATFKII
ncbi:3-hydroxyacyl-ACP dehydratase [Aurantibacter crassamenti]|uniref:3-hydroxyacyl-ACP dehydratase n=1 Tax=Aurantibacter crassamenti TaxID=1837375 RepID=UPI0019395716|nr:3-hydroxyacyl-ACP dehydratase [Aurantibacter crassamenti]MBM1105512.1 3-hydroxyacyl-ACP dehydratase [Aurantibacter crassamenti]